MAEHLTPQEWRVRRELRALAWFALAIGLVITVRLLADIPDPRWWLLRELVYETAASACMLRGFAIRPSLPRRCPDEEA